MTTMPTICVWRSSTLTWGERYGTTRHASEESGTPPGTGAAQHVGVGVGVRRRGGAAAMARTRGGRRSQRDRRRRTDDGSMGYGGNGMGVGLHCADAFIGVSPYCSSSSEVLLLSVVVFCDLCVCVWSLYNSIEISVSKMVAQPGDRRVELCNACTVRLYGFCLPQICSFSTYRTHSLHHTTLLKDTVRNVCPSPQLLMPAAPRRASFWQSLSLKRTPSSTSAEREEFLRRLYSL